MEGALPNWTWCRRVGVRLRDSLFALRRSGSDLADFFSTPLIFGSANAPPCTCASDAVVESESPLLDGERDEPRTRSGRDDLHEKVRTSPCTACGKFKASFIRVTTGSCLATASDCFDWPVSVHVG